jgi:hypothetical protein
MSDSSSEPILKLIFGGKSTPELEESVLDLLSYLSPEQSANVALYRNKSLNTKLIADTGVNEYYGTDAYELLQKYIDILGMSSKSAYHVEQASYTSVQYPPTDKHLMKTYMTPYAQVSSDAPSIGPGAKYEPHHYEAPEGPGFYPRWIETRHYKPILDAKFRVATIF